MPPSEPQPVPTRAAAAEDPRVYLAAERTFLAWIRTGLALMGFGFVVARFGLFLREIEFSQHSLSLHSGRFTLWAGTALILIGVIVNVFSALHHVHFVRAVKRGTETEVVDQPVTMAVAIALILAVTGVAMTIYLVFVR